MCFAATEDIRQKPSGTDVEISSLDDSMAVVGVRRRSLYNPVSSEQPACWHGGQELCVEPHSKSYAEVRMTVLPPFSRPQLLVRLLCVIRFRAEAVNKS